MIAVVRAAAGEELHPAEMQVSLCQGYSLSYYSCYQGWGCSYVHPCSVVEPLPKGVNIKHTD